MPRVRLVDLRREAGYPLSAPLLRELGRIAERGGKAILLLNRRGVAPAIHCRGVRCVPALPAVRRRAHAARRRPSPLPPLRSPRAGAARVPGLRVGRARADRRRHAAARDGAAPPAAGARAHPARRRHGRSGGGAARDDRALPGGRPGGADRHADGREGASLRGGRPGRGRRRRHGPLAARLPGRGAHLPARHAARGALGPRRPGARARADLPARGDAAAVRAAPRRGTASSPRSSSAGARSATRPFATSSRSSPPAATPARRGDCSREVRAGLEDAGHDLLGPAPLLRLRGRHRAQLVAKTDEPRRLARRAAELLASAGQGMRRDGLSAVVDVDPQSL